MGVLRNRKKEAWVQSTKEEGVERKEHTDIGIAGSLELKVDKILLAATQKKN